MKHAMLAAALAVTGCSVADCPPEWCDRDGYQAGGTMPTPALNADEARDADIAAGRDPDAGIAGDDR